MLILLGRRFRLLRSVSDGSHINALERPLNYAQVDPPDVFVEPDSPVVGDAKPKFKRGAGNGARGVEREYRHCSPTADAPRLVERIRTIRIGYGLVVELESTLLSAGLFNLELGILTSGLNVWGSDDTGCAFLAALSGSPASPARMATSAPPISMPGVTGEQRAAHGEPAALDKCNRTPGEKLSARATLSSCQGAPRSMPTGVRERCRF
jgi:hypothetical protein